MKSIPGPAIPEPPVFRTTRKKGGTSGTPVSELLLDSVNSVTPEIGEQGPVDDNEVPRSTSCHTQAQGKLDRNKTMNFALEFIEHRERVANFNHWIEKHKLNNFGMYLEGIVRKWIDTIAPGLESIFLRAFQQKDYNFLVEEQLRSRRQGEE